MTDGLLGPGGKDCLQTRHEFQVVPRLRLACILLPSPQPSPGRRGSHWRPPYSPLALWERARVRERSCYDISGFKVFETVSGPLSLLLGGCDGRPCLLLQQLLVCTGTSFFLLGIQMLIEQQDTAP